MLKTRHMQHGVSLVEIMIGLAVMAILLAMGAPSFSTFIQNTHIRNGAEAIQNGLNFARAEAVRRNTNVQFTLAEDNSWGIGCQTAVGDNDADGVDDCPAIITTKVAAEGSAKAAVEISEMTAATKAIVTPPASTLVFTGVGKIANLPPADIAVFDVSNPTAGTCLASGGSMRCLRVTVTAGGQVRVCDPALTDTTNPQAC